MRALATLFCTGLALCAAGCPALMSDDFVVRAADGSVTQGDATTDSGASEAGVRNGGEGGSDATIGDGGADGERSALDASDAAPIPRSCLEIHNAGSVADGKYIIDIDGPGPNPAFSVYCNRMATVEPLEYLELPANVEAGVPGANVSGFENICTASPPFILAFLKVRLDIQSLRIDRSDLTFAYLESDGGDAAVASVNGSPCALYATGCSCVRGGDTSGHGNADFTGTPFRMTAGTTFVPTGYLAACTAVFSPDRKRVDLSGGGYSGWCDVKADAGGLGVEFVP